MADIDSFLLPFHTVLLVDDWPAQTKEFVMTK